MDGFPTECPPIEPHSAQIHKTRTPPGFLRADADLVLRRCEETTAGRRFFSPHADRSLPEPPDGLGAACVESLGYRDLSPPEWDQPSDLSRMCEDQVPMEVDRDRGSFMAMMWIRDFARSKKGQPMREKLAGELMEAYNKTGGAIKKREDTHKMAEANKAFSHYRW